MYNVKSWANSLVKKLKKKKYNQFISVYKLYKLLSICL